MKNTFLVKIRAMYHENILPPYSKDINVRVRADNGFTASWIVRNKIRSYGLADHDKGNLQVVGCKKI